MYKSKKIALFTEYFKIKALLSELDKEQSKLFFFFPSYHMGGAERVHLDILHAFQEHNPICILTAKSNDTHFENEFKLKSRLINLGQYKSIYYKFYAKKVANILNKKENITVFGCNSALFYYMLPYLKQGVKAIDLLHAFSPEYNKASEKLSLPYVYRINKRVVLGNKTFNDYKQQYTENGIDLSLLSRIEVIPNKVDMPEKFIEKPQNDIKKVIFVARNSPEKRCELLLDIAKQCEDKKLPVEFFIVGDFPKELTTVSNVNILGILKKPDLDRLYHSADFLLMTSWREGLPMVILEAMAYGVIPVSTSVGEISSCIKNFVNGIIIPDNSVHYYIEGKEKYKTEYNKTKEKFCSALQSLIQNQQLTSILSKNAYSTIKDNFSVEKFNKSYKEIILGEA